MRVGAVLGVEDVAQCHHGAQIFGGEEQGHLGDLFYADPVFPGDAAAKVDAGFQDFPTCFENTLDFVVIPLIEKNDRVDIAVAGVEDVSDSQGVFLCDR